MDTAKVGGGSGWWVGYSNQANTSAQKRKKTEGRKGEEEEGGVKRGKKKIPK